MAGDGGADTMSTGILDSFDLIRIISLPERKDRRREMRDELSRAGLGSDSRVAFFDAIRPSDKGAFTSVGAHGVFLSHCAVLEEAVSLNASVLILEDDCDLSPDAPQYVPSTEWDIFYGGYIPADPGALQQSDIVGAHMMGFSKAGAAQVLSYLRAIRTSDIHPPIDGAYVWFRRDNPQVRTLFAEPPLGNQRPSRSDIEPGHFYNRLPVLKNMVQLVRQVRRSAGQRGLARTDGRRHN